MVSASNGGDRPVLTSKLVLLRAGPDNLQQSLPTYVFNHHATQSTISCKTCRDTCPVITTGFVQTQSSYSYTERDFYKYSKPL